MKKKKKKVVLTVTVTFQASFQVKLLLCEAPDACYCPQAFL